jgi:hypothetical protein
VPRNYVFLAGEKMRELLVCSLRQVSDNFRFDGLIADVDSGQNDQPRVGVRDRRDERASF